METAEIRAKVLLSNIIVCDLKTDAALEIARTAIRAALKNEQKITRHACAEAIMLLGDEYYEIPGLDPNRAYAAIMNTKVI